MKTTILLLVVLLGVCLAIHEPLHLRYYHHSGISVEVPVALYPTRTLEVIGFAAADADVLMYWQKRNHQVVFADPCPETQALVNAHVATLPSHLQKAYLYAKSKAAAYKNRVHPTVHGLREATCNTLIMYTDWQMEYNASSALFTTNANKYAESPMTPWLINQDAGFFNQCPLQWGTFGIQDEKYAGNAAGRLSNSTMISFREGLRLIHSIDAKYEFVYSEQITANTYTRHVQAGPHTIADISFSFNRLPGCNTELNQDLCEPLDWACFYYVNKYGQYIPCGFRTGEWIQHNINWDGGEYAIYRRYPMIPYTPTGFTPLTVLLFFGEQDYYDFEMVENYQLSSA